jgi:hypothetical protein
MVTEGKASETVIGERHGELENAPIEPHSYLQSAARLLRLADAAEAPEAKMHYVLLASLYQSLFELVANSRGRRYRAAD